jgi:hypothetical protein
MKPTRGFKTTLGGYFHGMVAKHIADELHLERTIWALCRTNGSEPYGGQRRSSSPGRSLLSGSVRSETAISDHDPLDLTPRYRI